MLDGGTPIQDTVDYWRYRHAIVSQRLNTAEAALLEILLGIRAGTYCAEDVEVTVRESLGLAGAGNG